MALLVHHKQQLFYAELLRTAGWCINIIAHPSSASASWDDIDHYLPITLGYHPRMETLVGTAQRKYVKVPPNLSLLTEMETMTDGMSYRYCVMTDNEYCPILLAKLLVMKNVVVLNVKDKKIMDFYESCTVQTEDVVKEMNARELRDLAESLYLNYTRLPCSLPAPKGKNVHSQSEDEVPEDKCSQPQQALVTKDNKGAQHLILTPTNGPESLPQITIWTKLSESGQVTKCQQMLLQRCWLDNRYPINKIRWIVQTHDGNKPNWWIWGGNSTRFQKEYPCPDTEFVVIWSLNHYYFPHSTYAKIKLLLDHGELVDCVGSSILGEHCLQSNQGYEIKPPTGQLADAAVVAYRTHRHPPESLRTIDWKGWVSTFMNLPFNYNAIRINFGDIMTDSKLPVIKLLGPDMRSFMNKLYRVSLSDLS